ncbi:MAG: ECF transporter S component [Lachnospiraceae bacterium]|nr:ECF transporter S component [Lachnospiraceae bacterium]
MNNQGIITRYSIKYQAIISTIAIAIAVILPQIFHLVGMKIGVGSSLGEVFLPMHFPVIFIGLYAGTVAGVFVGLCAPIISCIITGMPGAIMLPFIVVELVAYGVFGGLLRSININSLCKILLVQILGRAVKAIAILVSFYGFAGKVAPKIILTSFALGIVGIVLQLILISTVFAVIEKKQYGGE